MDAGLAGGASPDSGAYMDSGSRSLFRALIVVPDPAMAKMIQLTLVHGSFVARIEPVVAEAVRVIQEWRPHFAVADADVGYGRGIELVSERSGSLKLPLIALTRRGDLRTKVAALDAGADDIVTSPLAPEELVARARALVRRVYGDTAEIVPAVRVGDIEIDMLNRCVHLAGATIHLTSLEQALLYLLAANAGRVVSHDRILDALWGPEFVTQTNVIERHISTLRTKLQNGRRRPQYIETVRGQGYRMTHAGPS